MRSPRTSIASAARRHGAENTLVCTGYGQGIALVIDVLVKSGAKRVAVEDPCADDDAVPVARAAGLDVVGVSSGEGGIRIDALDRARRRGALIVEDDYDAEYRYDRAPIGAMQGLAPDRVIHAGTASKTLAPGLRLGWLVAPPDLVGPIAEAKMLADRGSPVLDQLAVADFLARGEFDRHVRRMRPLYRRRRPALLSAMRELTPGSTRPASPPACTSSRISRGTSTRRRWSMPRPGAGSPSTAWRPTGSRGQGAPASSSGTPPSARPR